jgi:hypothetical protein
MTINLPTAEGAALGSHLARFADAEIAKLRAEHPNAPERCSTCAFRSGTYPNACAVTLMNAFKCAMEHDPFYCHERDALCMGYLALKSTKPLKMPWQHVEGSNDLSDLTPTINQGIVG